MVLSIRVMETRKDFVAPPVQTGNTPNVAKVYLKLYIEDYQQEIEVYADWSDNATTKKTNIDIAIKKALDTYIDPENIKGKYTYDEKAKVLTKVI